MCMFFLPDLKINKADSAITNMSSRMFHAWLIESLRTKFKVVRSARSLSHQDVSLEVLYIRTKTTSPVSTKKNL